MKGAAVSFLRTPRGKLLTALGLLLLLVLGATGREPSATGWARGLLGLSAVGVLGLWAWRGSRGGTSSGFRLPEPLQVHARAGLSPRCGVALVEADGARFLVAYGEGFATIQRTTPPRIPRRHRRTRPVVRGAGRAHALGEGTP
jgi:flagellar protein FliO/FliZ